MKINRIFGIAAAFSGFLAVSMGAFGAHALRQKLPASSLEIFETAARYQMFHALALLAAGLAWRGGQSRSILWAGWMFITGTVLFCGSLYLLAVFDTPFFGAITPLGGLAFLAGWLFLAWTFIKPGGTPSE